jgi:hypothetical protein
MRDGDDDAEAADPDEKADRTVQELVEYCRVQAGLLAGRVETMAEEASDRIDEIDEGIAALREDLDATEGKAGDAEPTDPPDSTGLTDSEDPVEGDVAALADAESDLQRKQAMVEATESRMRLFQALATDYLELADELIADLETDEADPDAAVSRVVSFEAERDAPAYFEERETLVEVAAGADGMEGATASTDDEAVDVADDEDAAE